MDPRAYRIAQEFVRAQVRRARYAPEFMKLVDPQKFRNPETGNEVRFVSLPDDEQQRIYEAWREKNNVQESAPERKKPETREEITARNIEIARNGRETAREVLSAGGRATQGPVNESYIVTLEHDGQSQQFIFKPAEGEEAFLRVGIPAGQYHAREQAAYSIDAMLGDGGVVPVTHTRGNDDGSYQLWAEGARAMNGRDLDELVGKVSLEQLSSNPDFQRLNVLDLLMGHEDRHRGNLLYYFDGDETPENLRFAAIDNGLSMASPTGSSPDSRVYVHPFEHWYEEPGIQTVMDASPEDQKNPNFLRELKQKKHEEGKVAGAKAVARTLSRIPPELHERIKNLDLVKVAKSMTSAGVDEEGAVRATLVRIAALQADPTIFKEMLRRNGNDLEDAWQDFQHLSGWKDDLLWRSGAGDEAEKRIEAALRDARPRGGWAPAPDPIDWKGVLDGWVNADPHADTPRAEPPSTETWLESIEDEKHREVMWAISEAGELSETDLIEMLGGARKARKFSRKFDELRQGAPFKLEVVQTPEGKLYRKVESEVKKDERQVSQVKFDEHGFAILANVRDRWLASFIKHARGRNKLTVSEISPRDRKPRVVGIFQLERNGNVRELYKDSRFRRDIERGIRLMGKRFVPKDGAKFMAALEKVYGHRSMYDVKRT
jgi:hypothetical protein